MKNIKNYLLTVLCLTVWSTRSASSSNMPQPKYAGSALNSREVDFSDILGLATQDKLTDAKANEKLSYQWFDDKESTLKEIEIFYSQDNPVPSCRDWTYKVQSTICSLKNLTKYIFDNETEDYKMTVLHNFLLDFRKVNQHSHIYNMVDRLRQKYELEELDDFLQIGRILKYPEIDKLNEIGIFEEARSLLINEKHRLDWDSKVLEEIIKQTKNNSLKQFLIEHKNLYRFSKRFVDKETHLSCHLKGQKLDCIEVGAEMLRRLSAMEHKHCALSTLETIKFFSENPRLMHTSIISSSVSFVLLSNKDAQELFIKNDTEQRIERNLRDRHKIDQNEIDEAEERGLSLSDISDIVSRKIPLQFVCQVIDNGGTLELAYQYVETMQSSSSSSS